jgi:SDR family mycofactocin-dependent oxidoreductase
MGRLDGRVAFITGGARGQGRAIAERLAADGADIAIADIGRDIDALEYSLASSADAAETTARVEALGRRCLAFAADVREQEALDRAFSRAVEELGAVDVLVSNAGIVDYQPLWDISEEDWNTIVDVNLSGSWRAVKAAAAHFRERRAGSIVFNSSINGVEAGFNYAHYVSAKHGVLGLMKACALELGPYGVRSNAVLPTVIDAPINDHPASWNRVVGRRGATREEWLDATRAWHILRGRGALPERAVADAVAWLASDDAKHITGAAIPVDAGHILLPGVNPAPVAGPEPEHETHDPWPVNVPE